MKNRNRKYFTVKALEGVTMKGKPGKSDYTQVRMLVLDTDEAGTEKTYNGNWHENCRERTMEALVSLGWNGNVDSEGRLAGLGSVKAVAVEQDNEHEGKVSRQVAFINTWKPKGIDTTKAAPANSLDKFKALFAQAKTKVNLHPEASNIEEPAAPPVQDESPF